MGELNEFSNMNFIFLILTQNKMVINYFNFPSSNQQLTGIDHQTVKELFEVREIMILKNKIFTLNSLH